RSDEYFQLALQGPQAVKILQPFIDFGLAFFSTFHFKEVVLHGTPLIISRTGYTGEDGFEIYGPKDKAVFFWDLFLKAGMEYGLQPIGLAARDTLRLESAYSLYGHEITDTITPLESRLNWVVKLDKAAFIGKKSLVEQSEKGVVRTLVGFEITGKGSVPRSDFEVFSGDQKIGYVTSGTYSPTLTKSIGLALIDKKFGQIGSEIDIAIRKNKQRAKIVSLPFYKKKEQL
ncbi:MAG: glycine cleavage system protein T, partial [Flavobacteriales bacterium CG11_big_fil_rev_8_21_14_0_20_35_7]